MSKISFEWDVKKNDSNIKKHKVSFEEAKTVFYDNNAIEFFDPDHSETEDRFLLLGLSTNMRLLLICHCVRKKGKIIRIISARKATKSESTFYSGGK